MHIEERVFGSETEHSISLVLESPPENPPDDWKLTYRTLTHQPLDDIMRASRPGLMPVSKDLDPVILYKGEGFMSNGARFYTDMAHPEYSSAEVLTLDEIVAQEMVAERIVLRTFQNAVRRKLIHDFKLHKLVADNKGASWGYHENYQVLRNVLNPHLAKGEHAAAYQLLGAHLMSRVLYTGEGGVIPYGDNYRYVLSTKVMHTQKDLYDHTIENKPLINLRDVPYMDKAYTRLHIVSGAPNMNPWGTRMKFGTMNLLLTAMEEGLQPSRPLLFAPGTMHKMAKHIATDPSGRAVVRLADGTTVRAIDIQYELLEMAQNLPNYKDLSGDDAWVLQEWEAVLNGLSIKPAAVKEKVEWVLKRLMMKQFDVPVPEGGTLPKSALLTNEAGNRFTFDWTQIKPDSVATRLRKKSWSAWTPSEELVQQRTVHAPENTRAALREQYIRKLGHLSGAYLGWALLKTPPGKAHTLTDNISLSEPHESHSPLLDMLTDSTLRLA